MKTKLMFKCARCGCEYESDTRRFSIGRMKWHTVHYSQYSETKFGCVEKDPVDICNTCYDALKAFMKMDDSAEYYSNEIKERDGQIKALKTQLKELREAHAKLNQEMKHCKEWCPRETSVWKEFITKHNNEMIKECKLKEIY